VLQNVREAFNFLEEMQPLIFGINPVSTPVMTKVRKIYTNTDPFV
jgi:hypothetical protein